MDYMDELDVAIKASRVAGRYIMEEYQTFIPIPNAPVTISTEVDRNSQELILQTLHTAFPKDRLCAEEATSTLELSVLESNRVWIVDPIDGTRGFVTKNGEFSIMVGLLVDGQIQIGVVFEPAHQRLTYARKGTGCWVQEGDSEGKRCQVSSTTDLQKSRLIQSHSKSKEPTVIEKALNPLQVIQTYSAGIKLAYVARGAADYYINTYAEFRDWDICAGQLLVEEAGGCVTGLFGETIQYQQAGYKQKDGLLATNKTLHDLILTKLNACQGIQRN